MRVEIKIIGDPCELLELLTRFQRLARQVEDCGAAELLFGRVRRAVAP